jgi:DNA-binding XRE family transcriptional regulator
MGENSFLPCDFLGSFCPICRSISLQIVGNWPFVYCLQSDTIHLKMAKRRKQIQPRLGVEKAFGQVIRKIREDKLGISQAELEKRTGLDRTFISDLERGIQGPGIRTLYRIAKGLETPAWEILRLTNQSPLFVFPTGKQAV